MAYEKTAASPTRRMDYHTNPQGDIARPIGIGFILIAMTPLVILPLASIFIFAFGKGLDHFWEALVSPAAVFSLKLSLTTSSVATLCNVVFGLIADCGLRIADSVNRRRRMTA